MKIEFLLFEDILFLFDLKYLTDSNYTDYNFESILGEIYIYNRDNNVTDSDKLELN